MSYRGRALYNLLTMNLKEQPNLPCEEWQVENYRGLSEEILIKRLHTFSIVLDKETFLLYAEEVDSPEELTELLDQGKQLIHYEQSFLCLFELWRRFVPHKVSPSIFCDELDHLIEEYEEGNLECENDLQAALLKGQEILEDHVDKGGDGREAFALLAEFSCHDLEKFIYEYSAHQIDVENHLYASELLEGFYHFVTSKQWFDFLRLRLVFDVDREEGKVMIERLLEILEEKKDVQLLFEILHFLIYTGEPDIFAIAFERAAKELTCEGDLRELMMIASDYMNSMEKFAEEKEINRLLEERKGLSQEKSLESMEEIVQQLKEWMMGSLT